MKLRNGDEVQILQGKDKGRKGKIEKVFGKKNQILVSGLNIFKKNVKRSGNTPGGIIDIVKPINMSKVVLICPKCNVNTKIEAGVRNNKKVRVCKKCKQEI